MSDPKPVRRLSASRLKLMNDCSWRFYASEYLLWPEKVWPRTHVGTVAHAVFEALYPDKHREHYNEITMQQTIYASKAIARLVKIWQKKTNVSDELIGDIDPMVMMVLNHTDFLDTEATKRFEPEHEFTMVLRNGGKVRGYIDRMAFFGERAIVWDYKSQKERFDKDEVENSFQSLVYQWYVYKTYGLLAEVRYVLLRHPPTKKDPSKHIQITMPATPEQLAGFESYLEHMYGVINQFGDKEARANFKEDDPGFCRNVCTYYTSKEYVSILKKGTNQLVGNHLPEYAPQLKDDEYVVKKRFSGCPKFNR